MTKKAKTKVTIILDRSGSMWSCRDETVIGYNEHVQQFQEDCEEQNIEVSLLTFNGNVFEQFWAKPAAELQEAEIESFQPGGATALRDAVGYAIDKHNAELDTDAAYLLIVISDGQENKSQQYSPAVISELLEGCEKSGRWTITYMGCKKEDLVGSGMETLSFGNVATWDNKSKKAAARGMAASKMAAKKYMAARVFDPESFCPRSDYYDLSEDCGVKGPEGPCGAVGAADFTTDNEVLDKEASSYTPKGSLCATVFETSNRVIGSGVTYSRPQNS
jgi:hypothetical protein